MKTTIIKLNNIISDAFFITPKGDENNNVTLTFRIDDSGDSIPAGVFINSCELKYYNNSDIKCKGNQKINIHIDPSVNKIVKFYIKDSLNEYKIEYEPNIVNNDTPINLDYIGENIMNSRNASFMLLRTNPRLSGNVKIVVDSDGNLYLDTIKVNDELSNKKYRKNRISGNSYYSNDIRNNFKNIPSDDLYDVSDVGKNKLHIFDDINCQFDDNYHYGVKLNTDRLYSENLSMFAPLWINDILPEFFLIFRCDDYNNIINSKNAVERFKDMLKKSTLIKAFDMRSNTIIGNYINNHKSEITNYMTSVYIDTNKNGYNEWYGISIDNGVMTSCVESCYILDAKKPSQVELDNYITDGYKRNRLVNPYLLNFEFLFNDDSANNFSINHYFGVYITNNEFMELYSLFDGTASDKPQYYDKKTNEALEISEITFKNNIVNVLSDNISSTNFIIINNIDEIGNEEISNKPYKNILSANVIDRNQYYDKCFLTISINEPLLPGEHLRLIETNSSNNIVNIHELIARGPLNDSYINDNDNIVNEYEDGNKIIKIYRKTFSGYYNNDEFANLNKSDIIKKQLEEIIDGFESMIDRTFYISQHDNNSISFTAYDNKSMIEFQRITSDLITDFGNNEIIKSKNIDKSITYFNDFEFISEKIRLDDASVNKQYFPYSFESWNDRNHTIVPFIKLNENTHMYTIDGNTYNDIDKKSIVYIVNNDPNNDNNDTIINYVLPDFDIKDDENVIEKPKNIIKSPFYNNAYIIMCPRTHEIIETDKKINIYSVASLHLNVIGLLPIKDFNFNVLADECNNNMTEKYNILYKDEDDAINEIIEKKPIENINDYKNIPLVTPINCKWCINGIDYVGNEIKISADTFNEKSQTFNDASSLYLLTDDDKFNKMFGWPHANSDMNMYQYLYTDVNDFVNCNGEIISIRDLFITKGISLLNIFSNSDDNIKNKFTHVYYNEYQNRLRGIICGKMISIGNIPNIRNYDNYMLTIINSPSYNYNNYNKIEMFIDEDNKTIIIVKYLETYNATYTNRYNYDQKVFNSSNESNLSSSFKRGQFDVNLKNIIDSSYLQLNKTIDASNSTKPINIFLRACKTKDVNNFVYESNYTYDMAVYLKKYALNINGNIMTCKDASFDSSSVINKTNNNVDEFIFDSTSIIKNVNTFDGKMSLFIKNSNVVNTNIIIDSDITFEEPGGNNKLKTYAYYANPEFVDIVEFYNDCKDDKLIKGTKRNYIGCNTDIFKINPIKQLWYNKISDSVFDITSTTDTINIADQAIDVLYDYDTTISPLYGNMYKTYKKHITDKDEYYYKINMSFNEYLISENKRMFFGAAALLLNDNETNDSLKNNKIILTEFNNNFSIRKQIKKFNNSDDAILKYKLKFNITDMLISAIKNKSQLLNSWNVKYNKNIDKYIVDTILNNFFIINNKNILKIYKVYNENGITPKPNEKVIEYNDNINAIEVDNITSELSFENDKYFINVELPNDTYKYAFKYIIEK